LILHIKRTQFNVCYFRNKINWIVLKIFRIVIKD